MSQIFKRFLTEEAARLNPGSNRFLALGAFGKHPGWDDHVEDLGLETESLVLAKRLLYIEGVGGQIDTGAWEKLEPSQRLEEFDHVFVWQRTGQLLLGRLWSSSDGKGRTRYPMVVCAHCIGTSLTWALDSVLPRLRELEQACKAANTSAEVRSLLERARSDLRARLPGAESETEFTASHSDAFRKFIGDAAFGPEQQGWFRILYQLDTQMAPFALNNFNSKTDVGSLRPQQIRLPTCGNSPDQVLLLWRRFLATRIDRNVPVLLMLPSGENWLDATFGEPATQEFFCLRARPAVLPLATEIPYDLAEPFKAKARTFLSDLRQGNQSAAASVTPAAEPPVSAWVSITQRWFRGKGAKLLLIGLLCLALLAAVALWMLSSSGPPSVASGHANLAASAKAPAASQPASRPASPPVVPPGNLSEAPPSLAGGAPPTNAPAPQLEPAATTASPSTSSLTTPAVASTSPENKATAPDSHPAPPPVPAAVPAQSNQATVPAPQPNPTLASTEPSAALAAAGPAAKPAGVVNLVVTNTVGMVLVWIASLPGCAEGGYVSKFEVTQAQYERIMGTNPSQSKNPSQPVESVTWDEAVDFCRKLTAVEQSRATPPLGLVYGLPSEAQWQFFLADARFEDAVTSRVATHDSPAQVGSLAANRFGLHDVLGNVWEFCSDVPNSTERLLHGAGFDNRKLFGEKATEWRPLERTTPRRLSMGERAADAGFRCVALVQP